METNYYTDLQKSLVRSRKRALRYFFLLGAVAIILLAALTFHTYKQNHKVLQQIMRIEAMRHQLLYNDEVLHMSMQLAINEPNNSHWRNRYKHFYPRFNKVIMTDLVLLMSLDAPPDLAHIMSTAREIERFELMVFKKLDQKKNLEAKTLVQSKQYRLLNNRYRAQLDSLSHALLTLRLQEIGHEKILILRTLVAHILLVVILLLAWLTVVRREKQLLEIQKTELERLAKYDFLTGLPNRYHFEKALDIALSRSNRFNRQFVLFYIDIDDFKPINDTWGHDVGDILLQQFAKRLQSNLRDYDTIARIGGDEFSIIVDDIPNEAEATIIESKLKKLMLAPFNLNQQDVTVRFSIGHACYPRDGNSPQVLKKHADEKLYEAKANKTS